MGGPERASALIAAGPADERSWAGLPVGSMRWNAVTTTARPQRRTLPAAAAAGAILLALVGLLTASALALQNTTPVAAGPATVGDLPGPPPAVRAADIDPEAPPPRSLAVERLGIAAAVGGVRVQADGALEVPTDFSAVGWYRDGTAPGDRGPAVLVGHVDSYEGPAVFFRLRELVPGDRVRVGRADGSSRDFEVYGTETVPKDAFPSERVYGPTEQPELRLVTCGGAFDTSSRQYTDNVVVYLREVPEAAAS